MNQYFITLLKTFEDQFVNSLSQINPRKKSSVIKYIGSLFRRWYYSSCVEDTYLSPANLFCVLLNGEMTIPSIRMENGAFHFTHNTYSLESHPVVGDLLTLVEFCKPDIDMDGELSVNGASICRISEKMSIYDPFYTEYLAIVAITLKLLSPFPSIHTNRMQVSKNYERFKRKPEREIFEDIVKASVVASSTMLRENVNVFGDFFTEGIVKKMLAEPLCTDELFTAIYTSSDTGLEAYLDMEEPDPELFTNTMALGFLYDKYFLSVFGYYLKLIDPFYSLPFEFEREVNYLSGIKNEDLEFLLSAIFMPSSHYRLTKLGSEYMKKPAQAPEINIQDGQTAGGLIDEVLRAPGDADLHKKLQNAHHIGGEFNKIIYEFKVWPRKCKDIWINLEIQATASLYQLFDEISFHFNLDPSTTYSFFLDKNENPFTEYSNKNFNRPGKTPSVTLQQIIASEKREFLLAVHGHKFKFEMELLKTKDKSPKFIYPRVSRLSRYFRELEKL